MANYWRRISPIDELSRSIERHYTETRPNKQSQVSQEKTFNFVAKCARVLQDSELDAETRVLTHIKPSVIAPTRWKVFMFGSRTDGTALPASDVDIAIYVNFKNTRQDKEQLLFKLSQIIAKNDEENALFVKCILRTRYPIIKICDLKSREHANVSIADRFCQQRNELIKSYIAHHNRIWSVKLKSEQYINQIIVFVKHWSKSRGINDACMGYINSFGWMVLVLKFVQWFEVHKLEEKEWNLGQMVGEFYLFYTSKFDWRRHCVSINRRLSSDEDCKQNKEKIFAFKVDRYCAMEVVDPVNVNNNIARNVRHQQAQHIYYEFVRAVSILERNTKDLFAILCDTESESEFSDDL